MKLALIPPIDLLSYTERTNFQLALPHLMENMTYRDHYLSLCQDSNQYVILDNGEAEGVETSPQDLVEMAAWMGVDEIVLPDVIKDAEATEKRSKEFLDKYEHLDFSFMYVAQGKTVAEFQASIVKAATDPRVSVIGIPRHAIETCHDTDIRYSLVYYARRWTTKDIHLLGGSPHFPNELDELGKLFNQHRVRSTDTSSPFNYAYAHAALEDGAVVRRPESYFDIPLEMFEDGMVLHNVLQLEGWVAQ